MSSASTLTVGENLTARDKGGKGLSTQFKFVLIIWAGFVWSAWVMERDHHPILPSARLGWLRVTLGALFTFLATAVVLRCHHLMELHISGVLWLSLELLIGVTGSIFARTIWAPVVGIVGVTAVLIGFSLAGQEDQMSALMRLASFWGASSIAVVIGAVVGGLLLRHRRRTSGAKSSSVSTR